MAEPKTKTTEEGKGSKKEAKGWSLTYKRAPKYTEMLVALRQANATTGKDGKARSASEPKALSTVLTSLLDHASETTVEALALDLEKANKKGDAEFIRKIPKARTRANTKGAAKTLEEAKAQIEANYAKFPQLAP